MTISLKKRWRDSIGHVIPLGCGIPFPSSNFLQHFRVDPESRDYKNTTAVTIEIRARLFQEAWQQNTTCTVYDTNDILLHAYDVGAAAEHQR